MQFLCYKDSRFKIPSKIIRWALYIRIFCILGYRKVNHIQSECMYERDFKTVKSVNYYVDVHNSNASSLISRGYDPLSRLRMNLNNEEI